MGIVLGRLVIVFGRLAFDLRKRGGRQVSPAEGPPSFAGGVLHSRDLVPDPLIPFRE